MPEHGNQNARRHGWYSRARPTPLEEIITAARLAIAERDTVTLRNVARAIRDRGYHDQAARLRRIAAQMELLNNLDAAGIQLSPDQQEKLLENLKEAALPEDEPSNRHLAETPHAYSA